MPAKLNLVVIHVANLQESASFYSSLGLSLVRERHGTGPEHYSADLGGTVLELYPRRSESEGTAQTRLGFSVNGLDGILAACLSSGGRLVAAAKDSPWGRRAVLQDPDGHKIELIEGS